MLSPKIVTILVFFLVVLHQYVAGEGQGLSNEEHMDLERQISILKKKSANSFQNGDLHECVNIFKQPGLDHPLLKNHKIQMRPTYQPTTLIDRVSSKEHIKIDISAGISCPQGMVPIQRTQKEDLIGAKTFSGSQNSNIHPQTVNWPGEHVVALRPHDDNSTYYGMKARITTQSLDVKENQFSTAQMWIENGPLEQYTSLQAGWMISPRIAGNKDTRLFIYWTTDNSKTGCYNHRCPGFVQVHPRVGPGSLLHPSSIYGEVEYGFIISIFQDNVTGNWWLIYQGMNIGYWPKSVIPQLDRGASLVAWGGLVVGPANEDSPPMGNGHFPQGVWSKACYMDNLHIIDASRQYVIPDEYGMVSYVDNPNCYGLQYMGYYKAEGLSFMFGGPGGKCGV